MRNGAGALHILEYALFVPRPEDFAAELLEEEGGKFVVGVGGPGGGFAVVDAEVVKGKVSYFTSSFLKLCFCVY